MKTTILLLGATGYLGGNIAVSLCEAGYDVICVVRKTSDISRLKSLDVTLISNEPGEIDLILRTRKIDWIINGVCTYKANDTLYGDILESNIIFPLTVLNLAVKYGVKNFITMGTSLPDDINLYSYTKKKFSEFGQYLSVKDGINFIDLQLEMFYGGLFEPGNRFISSCRIKLQKGIPLDLTKGTQKRDMIRVEDISAIICRLIESNYVSGYKSLPVGSGEQHPIKEVIKYMHNVIGSKSELHFGAIPSRKGEPDTLADISWYDDIGYKLKFSFFDGLKEECGRSNS